MSKESKAAVAEVEPVVEPVAEPAEATGGIVVRVMSDYLLTEPTYLIPLVPGVDTRVPELTKWLEYQVEAKLIQIVG